MLGANGMLMQMHDEGELDATDPAQVCGKRVNIKIPGTSSVMIPLDIIGFSVNNIRFTNIVVVIYP
jgi:hypothetical protein